MTLMVAPFPSNRFPHARWSSNHPPQPCYTTMSPTRRRVHSIIPTPRSFTLRSVVLYSMKRLRPTLHSWWGRWELWLCWWGPCRLVGCGPNRPCCPCALTMKRSRKWWRRMGRCGIKPLAFRGIWWRNLMSRGLNQYWLQGDVCTKMSMHAN